MVEDENYPKDSPYWRLRYRILGDLSLFKVSGPRFQYKVIDHIEGRAVWLDTGSIDFEDEESDMERAIADSCLDRSWLTEEPLPGTMVVDDQFLKKMFSMGSNQYRNTDWIDRDESVREVFGKTAQRLHNTLDPHP